MAKGDKKGTNHLPIFRIMLQIVSLQKNEHCLILFKIIKSYAILYIGALYLMKRKKLHEAELTKIENVKMTLETQCINLESASQNKDTFLAMKEGKNAMAKIRTEVGIDQVDELMDDIREEMEQAQEISDAIAAPVDPLATDEDELLAELEQMGADDLEAELLSAPGGEISLPSVPDAKLPAYKKKEEEELKALEAELAGL